MQALQVSIGANRASKDTKNITMTDNAATGDDNTDNAITGDDNTDNASTGKEHVHLPLCPSGKSKHPNIKTSSKHTTAIVKASGHTLDLGDEGIYGILIQGTPNPPDGSKPEVAKQHYERFNQYIKFQTKSGNIKDPIVEAI